MNGRTLDQTNIAASNGIVHTVRTFIFPASWTDSGGYIEQSSDLSSLADLMVSVDLLDTLKGAGFFFRHNSVLLCICFAVLCVLDLSKRHF